LKTASNILSDRSQNLILWNRDYRNRQKYCALWTWHNVTSQAVIFEHPHFWRGHIMKIWLFLCLSAIIRFTVHLPTLKTWKVTTQ